MQKTTPSASGSQPAADMLHAEKDGRPGMMRRLAMLSAGMLLCALGIAAISSAHLGTTPISTVPLTLASLAGITFGTATFFFNLLLIAAQALLYARVSAALLLQLPCLVLFGLFLDGSMAVLAPLEALSGHSLLCGSLLSLAGNFILAAGIVVQLRSLTVLQSGEGIVLAASLRFRQPFPKMKMANDVSLTLIAAVLGLLFAGRILHIGAGTLVSAFLVGSLVKIISRIFPENSSNS